MKTFVAKMSVTTTEEWVVEANTEEDARLLIHNRDDSVTMEEGAMTTDWQIDSIKVEA